LQFTTSSKYTIDVLLNNVLFRENELVLLLAIIDSPKLNNHHSILISTEGYIADNNDIEYSNSLMLFTNGQIEFNGNTMFV